MVGGLQKLEWYISFKRPEDSYVTYVDAGASYFYSDL